jgi:hypothetical protein
MRELMNILFAPHKFRSIWPKWLSKPHKFVELCNYNHTLKLAIEYRPNKRKLHEYVDQKCEQMGVKLIVIPYGGDLEEIINIIKQSIDDRQAEILNRDYDEKIKRCAEMQIEEGDSSI